MKNWFILSAPILLGAIIACNKTSDLLTDPRVSTKATHGTDTVLIGFYDTIRIPDRNSYITMDTIYDDSRCPLSAMCIWAGAYEVGINMTSDGAVHPLKLGTYPGQVADTLLHGMEIKLLDLIPYPDLRKQILPAERKVKVGLFW